MQKKKKEKILLTSLQSSLSACNGIEELLTGPLAPISSQAPQKSHHIRIPKRILGFSLVGGGVMLGGIAFLFILVQFFHVEKHVAYILQAIASIETNFLLNRFFNWKDRKGKFLSQWIKFHSTSAVTFPLNQALFALLTWLGVSYLLITFIGAGIAALVDYFANDRFVFHHKSISPSTLRSNSLPLMQAFRFLTWGLSFPYAMHNARSVNVFHRFFSKNMQAKSVFSW